jgi:hypothetical protein
MIGVFVQGFCSVFVQLVVTINASLAIGGA